MNVIATCRQIIFICVLLLAMEHLAHADTGTHSQNAACRDWSFGQREAGPEKTLSCLQHMQANGQLKAMPMVALNDEVNHSYVQTARTGEPVYVEIIRIVSAERNRRRPPEQPDDLVYSALMMAGQVKAADAERRRMRLDIPEVSPAKMIEKATQSPSEARYWTFAGHSPVLVENSVDLTLGKQIIVYCAAGCGFCREAAADIASKPSLLKTFRNYSLWVVIPDGNFNQPSNAEWERQAPSFPLHAILDRKNWPQQTVQGTPTFIFMKDGQVIHELLGWTPGNQIKLQQYLNEMAMD